MGKENRDMVQIVLAEHLNVSQRASAIARGIAAALSIMYLYYLQHLPLLLILFWTLDILQYAWLSIRADLVLREILSIRVSNKLELVGQVMYLGKIIIALVVLWGA